MRRWAQGLATALLLLWPQNARSQERAFEYERLVDRYRAGRRNEAVLELGNWEPRDLAPVFHELLGHPWPKSAAAAMLHTDRALHERAGGDREGYTRQLQYAARLARTVPNLGAWRGFRSRWFLAVGLTAGDLDDLMPWVREGLDSDPDDPALLLALGAAEETIASFGQGKVYVPLAERSAAATESKGKARVLRLEQAKRDLRRALKADPDLQQARLRLAHVLKFMRADDDALAELEIVVAQAQEPSLLYLAQLMLGEIHETRRHYAEAETAYTAATALEPRCQAGYIALSFVRWRRGDLAGAADARARALAHGTSASGYSDPWWSYPHGLEGHAEALLEALRQAAAQ